MAATGSRPPSQSTASGEVVRVGIVDNDPLVSTALIQIFQHMLAPILVLWTAKSGKEALRLCGEPSGAPEVVLTDIEMPGMSGIELAAQLRLAFPGIAILGLTAFRVPERAEQALALGFEALFPKDVSTSHLVRALGQAAQQPAVATWEEPTAVHLSDAEIQIMSLYADGRTSMAISHRLGVSETTVKTHAKRAFAKLGVHSRSEAIAVCVQNELI
ncbi:response regulator [Bifidobacterium aquikefiri]|uniref:response regulator transcription factor n=1 Tax=Bifidobacterium aquikefiri TaxID=1653207 RepID=UPI0023F1D0AC|nr:response regulator transcription factor [Bifidobacterium aquikefiri]